jgi:hypothetical protein
MTDVTFDDFFAAEAEKAKASTAAAVAVEAPRKKASDVPGSWAQAMKLHYASLKKEKETQTPYTDKYMQTHVPDYWELPDDVKEGIYQEIMNKKMKDVNHRYETAWQRDKERMALEWKADVKIITKLDAPMYKTIAAEKAKIKANVKSKAQRRGYPGESFNLVKYYKKRRTTK